MLISIHALLAESDRRGGVACYLDNIDFYPRSPCGERHDGLIASANFCKFLSTLSLRRATKYPAILGNVAVISIHALLAESDESIGTLRTVSVNFYPRSPCGERLSCAWSASKLGDFYPRSPCGERLAWIKVCIDNADFYPRSPCGERLVITPTPWALPIFLSTLSLRRATDKDQVIKCLAHISIHALLAESD